MEIKKKTNYVKFADKLESLTGCDVRYCIMKDKANHIHYELNKQGVSLGVLCYDEGELSIAPFRSFDNLPTNEEFIYFNTAPQFSDFADVLVKLGSLVLD